MLPNTKESQKLNMKGNLKATFSQKDIKPVTAQRDLVLLFSKI